MSRSDRSLSEGIDYNIDSDDPAPDDCIHEDESGPHEHRRFLVLRFLAGLNLCLLAVLLVTNAVGQTTNLTDAARYWREAGANAAEWQACEQKHSTLLKQIKKEGLWKRLGMGGQPWLR